MLDPCRQDEISACNTAARSKADIVAQSAVGAIARAAVLENWESFSGCVGMARRMAQNGVPSHEIERQGRLKQGSGMVGRYTRGESAGSALRYL